MTLLASERSLLIRNKFRSVLQLRIQNRRQQNEINADSGLKSACPSHKGEKDQSEALRLSDDGATQKSPPSGLNTETAQVRGVYGAQRQKKARQSGDLGEKIQYRRGPGALELLHTHTPPLDSRSASFPLPADVFEDDVSSCSLSSSPGQLGIRPSPAFSSSPGLPGDRSLGDLSPAGPTPRTHSPAHAQSGLALLPATEGISQPMSMTVGDSNSMATTGRPKGMYLTSQNAPLLPKTAMPPSPASSSPLAPRPPSPYPSRPRKPRDCKPKMRKLKYHQYIPPDQRVAAGTGGGGATQKSPAPAQPIDPAYSRLLQQQQVFLQLQILQDQQNQQSQQEQQEQLALAPSGDPNQTGRFSGAPPQKPQPVPAATNPAPADTSPAPKPELLPPNLVDLTVSELRQQLRKRGLPVSGTKPALLQRLRPFQLPRTCLTPTPLCQLGTSLEPLPPSPLLPPSQSPGSSPGSGPESPGSPNQPGCVQAGAVPCAVPSGVPNGILSGLPNAFPRGISLSVGGAEPCGLANAVFLAPAVTPSATPSPGLPPPSSSSASSPRQSGAPWQSEQEQQHQQEMSLELEMRERIRSRPRDRAGKTGSESRGPSLHPFLQQEPGCQRGKPGTEGQTEVLFTQVFCCQPCDVIGQDFELPMQITASPMQAPPSVRSLEEELQEAIQKAQMDPIQSIDDILDEPISCVESVSAYKSDLQSPVSHLPGPSPPPQTDQSQPFQRYSKDDNFLSSPLCSSILLELPPSPAATPVTQVAPPLPPPRLCTSPLPSAMISRKRRALVSLDPADWLETLTSGLRALSPPAAPFVETDFGLDSDLNISRVLDLMVEQW